MHIYMISSSSVGTTHYSNLNCIAIARVHNINIKRECRTLDRPRTNTLRKVEPVNYRKSSYFVHTL